MNSAGGNDASGTSTPRITVDNSAFAQSLQLISPHGIFTTDADLRIASWNEWMVAHSGLAATAVVGRLMIDLFPELRERRLHDRYLRVLKGEVSVLSTALHKYLLPFRSTVPESGTHMLQTARIAPLRQGDEIAGTLTVIEDVTQREYQSAILQRQQEMDRLLSSALAILLQSGNPSAEVAGIFSQVIPLLGLDAFVCYLVSPNEKFLQLHGVAGISSVQRDAINSLPISEIEFAQLRQSNDFTKLTIASHAGAIKRLNFRSSINFPLAGGARLLGLVTFASYDRALISVSNLKALARIAGYVGIALDRVIRERDIISASRAKDDFLAALSHELRTPLNPVVLVASDSAQNPDFPPEAREAFRMIEKNALLEARLIDDLLDLTKIERGKLSLEIQKVDVHVVLSGAVETIRADLGGNKLSLHFDLRAARKIVNGDIGRLQQVFWNVIKNAVKFTPPGGEMWISSSLDESKDRIVVKIRDSGIGLDTNEAGRIFEAFTQGDHAVDGHSHRFGGMGLGLAISRKIMDLHGGTIEASSDGKGQGSTFTLFLPLVSVADEAASLSAELVHARKTVSSGQMSAAPFGAAILLVEDHEPTRKTLGLLLQRKGYTVVSAGSAEAALEEAARRKFDLVLSDIGLPDSDGFELMKTLAKRYGLKGIALTGYGMESDLQRSAEAGFFAHLTKPINASTLDRTLTRAFSSESFPLAHENKNE